jgi:hypothetical protein
MSRIDEALAAIESLDECETFTYTEIANRYGVSRSTLGRRHRGIQASRTEQAIKQQLLNPQQELELVKYIIRLTEDGLPPTREMIQSFASTIVKGEVGNEWVTRFIHRHEDDLVSKWTSGMDRNRHEADSGWKYECYFNLLHSTIDKYDILPENTYNMDEKGFMMGSIGKSKRVFSRQMWDKGQVKDSIQDGSRTWISILACVGADGITLPPGLIYEALHGNIRDTWVEDIEVGKHEVFVTLSPSGWSNDAIGFAWLTQVFERFTKEKARRK